ncbi:RadC-like JAB domain protein [Capnocytophaga sp. oral taxon 412 str. F0487]|uniref:RadC family protein n=1 Tax=Capnocytophaga sp. oral taxon 412 TaxID=712218 RepID=UPI00026964C6|nr:DNA repair protein RadC [Capnocytophaga sp. oral taxon 412]EIW93045.1 RadC-like JAB domain protein [Capnocytophaga sp. oral taxon 412 str. F0487]
MTIKNWADTDKPREKMISQGKTALSNAELLAILLGSGSADESAVELSRRILASVNNSLTTLGKQSLQQLQAFKGIGQAKAITILAATEMGRRRTAETPELQPKIEVAHNVFTLMQPLIGELPHEEFWVLYLNSTNRVIHKARLFSGGITHTTVDVRLLFKTALEQGAIALILVHNHPSGSITPSKEDIELTQRVKTAGDMLDIKLLDHVIVTEKEYLSLLDERLF